MYNVPNATTFIMLFYCSGKYVSTLIGSSSGPSKTQILKLTIFKMHCGIPTAYILDITMYKIQVALVIITQPEYLVSKI